ncbi:PREDICTED: glutamate receptor 3.2 isoform X1 [Theobroma cacao]|uniref:Glutamate receptor 3.2 isoform X1 n=1 Tax=Theobroma cacao TaxID=3641 RepID=A0AB32VSM2_THECC|nr:PREDICTED: glutamate receptor 3.2 isoform X1 [Theobroma cacao]
MKKWITILSTLLVTPLLLLSSLDCTEGRDEDVFGSVGFRAQSNREKKASVKMGRAEQVVCSISTRPGQMVLMFKLLHGNSTLVELADCSEVRTEDHGDEKGIEKIQILGSVPLIPDRPQIQLSFFDWHGNITPTKLNDYYLTTINGLNHDALVSFCTLTSYEAKLKWGQFTRKTRATIFCGLREISRVIPERVPQSTYMTHCIYKTIQEIVKLISFYQWGKSSSTYVISGLDIATLELTSHPRKTISRQFQMTATISFSTSLQHTRVLTVAVLVGSTFKQFANVSQDDDNKEPQLKGLSIDVFKATVAVLPNRFTYKLVPFYRSCDQLLKEVARKAFHAALGGIVITAERSHLVEFSQPYAKLGLVMVVKKKNNELKDMFWFMSPLTREMWLIMAAMTVLTGFVIRVIEHRTCNEMPSRHVEAVVCFPFAFLLNEYRPRNKLSFYVLVPWLILILIVTTTFTASLSSMVASSQADEPSHLNADSLRKTNAAIATDGNSFTVTYLVKSLGFKRKNIRKMASVDDCANALSSGNVKAAFLLMPDANVFLARYCCAFAKSGPAYNLGSFGFVFPRGSPLAADMSEAILNLKEAGELQQMEEDTLSISNCSSSTSDETFPQGIGPGVFSGLFILSGGASATALAITVIRLLKRRWESCIQRMLMGRGLLVWLTILFSPNNQTTNELRLARISSNQ